MSMLSHGRIWAAIDALAARHSLSVSGLAKRSGLDATAFNKSKRQASDGRPRWPSTESLAKILDSTDTSITEFVALTGADKQSESGSGKLETPMHVPLIGFAQAGAGGYFDDAGFPAGQGWDRIAVPSQTSEESYALSVQGDSMMPLYRDGDILIVDPNATIRRGDRVVTKTLDGEIMAKILARKSATVIRLASLNADHPDRSFAPAEIEWMARIVWASQ